MVLDPFTLLVLTTAMAAASALYLTVEWSSVRERSLLLWSAGFAVIAVMLSLLIFIGEAVRDAFDPRKTFR